MREYCKRGSLEDILNLNNTSSHKNNENFHSSDQNLTNNNYHYKKYNNQDKTSRFRLSFRKKTHIAQSIAIAVSKLLANSYTNINLSLSNILVIFLIILF